MYHQLSNTEIQPFELQFCFVTVYVTASFDTFSETSNIEILCSSDNHSISELMKSDIQVHAFLPIIFFF